MIGRTYSASCNTKVHNGIYSSDTKIDLNDKLTHKELLCKPFFQTATTTTLAAGDYSVFAWFHIKTY